MVFACGATLLREEDEFVDLSKESTGAMDLLLGMVEECEAVCAVFLRLRAFGDLKALRYGLESLTSFNDIRSDQRIKILIKRGSAVWVRVANVLQRHRIGSEDHGTH